MKRLLDCLEIILIAASTMFAANSFAAVTTTGVNVLSYSGTNVSTSAYVALVASTPFLTSHVEVCDTSTKLLKIASGTVGNEVDLFTTPVSGCIVLPYIIRSGTRLSIKAVDATATSGFNTVTFFP